MYAVVDLETTGGRFSEEGITEVAIYRFDGHQVVDRLVSLVNPFCLPYFRPLPLPCPSVYPRQMLGI